MNEELIWLGSQESWDRHLMILRAALANTQLLLRGGDSPEPDNPVGMEVIGDKLALITVSGGTIAKTTGWSWYYGVPSYEDIRSRVAEAADNADIKAILLSLDTPGGHANGTAKLSRFISDVSSKVKPVVTFNDGSMASAGLWYGTAVSQVVSDEDSRTGSLGVLALHLDYTKMLENDGVKATVLRTSPYKALGNPYEPLTEEAKKSMMEDLNAMHNSFVNAVAVNRNIDPAEVQKKIATGKMYPAKQALELGVVDRILSLDETVARMLKAFDNTKAA